LNAIKNNKTYVVLPYNYYTTNIETELLNAYYIGTIIYPSEFANISIENKAAEIYTEFLGTNVYPKMQELYGGYYQLNTSAL
ncbi:MAG: iron ABC transporter substrate-binding protein, partial [Promethearchaeota archaeon]